MCEGIEIKSSFFQKFVGEEMMREEVRKVSQLSQGYDNRYYFYECVFGYIGFVKLCLGVYYIWYSVQSSFNK